MFRLGVLAACAAVIAGAAFLTGASVPPKPTDGPIKLDAAKATVGQKTGYFNMTAVMRGNKKAQAMLKRTMETRKRVQANVDGLRAMQDYLHHETMFGFSRVLPPSELPLGRSIQVIEFETNPQREKQISAWIAEIYNDIHSTTAEMARERGLVAVLAFADGVTPQELNDPMVKELKLKPQAAYPFYVDPSVDYTQELLERLNAKFDAAEKGK